jgi:serine/threonine protein kinase
MQSDLPQTFGRYILRERVGQGGMAEVFRASLPGFGGFDKVVAVKRMFREYASDSSFIEMLTDEAKIVSQLAHPNIVQILDVGQTQGDYFIAFEYVEGVDLFRLLQRHHELGRDLPVNMACYAIAELCSALDYAHSRRTMDGTPLGIVHRDVSPQNVLLSLIGEVKLTDFGIAKAAYRYTHTQAGMVKGKIYYMSPEQVLGQPIDHRSDLFAAGILLYEMLCTRPLYDEVDQKALYEKVSHAQYAWPADKVGRVPPGLRAVVDQALRPDAGSRFQTGRAMRDAVLQAARESGQVTDREDVGRYLRAMYDVAENRPASVVALAPRVALPGPALDLSTGMGVNQERWHSKVAPLPEDSAPRIDVSDLEELPPDITSRPVRRPEARPGRVPLPQPGAMVRPHEPPTEPPTMAQRPADPQRSHEVARPDSQRSMPGPPPPVLPARPTPRPQQPPGSAMLSRPLPGRRPHGPCRPRVRNPGRCRRNPGPRRPGRCPRCVRPPSSPCRCPRGRRQRRAPGLRPCRHSLDPRWMRARQWSLADRRRSRRPVTTMRPRCWTRPSWTGGWPMRCVSPDRRRWKLMKLPRVSSTSCPATWRTRPGPASARPSRRP